MVHTTCAALHCLSSSKTNKTLRFHQFPHDKERREIWIKACKRTDVIDRGWDYFKYKYVCSKHFQKCMYGRKDNLKKSAIPSLYLAQQSMQYDACTQTWESLQYQEVQENNIFDETLQTPHDLSIFYVVPNLQKLFNTTHTQTEEYILNALEIKNEIGQGNGQFEDSEDSMQEYDHDKEIKIEIVENEITYTPSDDTLQCVDLDNEIKKEPVETRTSYTQTDEEPLQEGEQTKPPIEKVDQAIQTDKLIVYSLQRKRLESRDPQYCECRKRKKTITDGDIQNITLTKFLSNCKKFLPYSFCSLIQKQVYLELLSKQLELSKCPKMMVDVGVSENVVADGDTAIPSLNTSHCTGSGNIKNREVGMVYCDEVGANVSICKGTEAVDSD